MLEESNTTSSAFPTSFRPRRPNGSRDWPVIELLVTIHHRENAVHPTAEHVDFWLREARTAELLVDLCDRFPREAHVLATQRPLIQLARQRTLDAWRAALDAEVRAEQAKDHDYWEPLRRELERYRHEQRGG